jgi:putative two-component system response regulator
MDDSRKLIMMVDDDLTNLKMGKIALSDKYKVLTVTSAEKMLELMMRHTPDLILLDINMPDINGFEAIKMLKARPKTCNIPVIFLTAQSDHESELQGLSLGAIDYISKPFSEPLLNKRIEVHLLVESQKQKLQEYNDNLQAMVSDKTQTIVKLQNKIMQVMAKLVEYRDNVTGMHIERTVHCLLILMTALMRKNLYTELTAGWDINLLLQSSQLHDIGKIAIRDNILLKPGRLSPEEFNGMKRHVELGINIIDKIANGDEESIFLDSAKVFAGYHHEKWDGSGYPQGLKGEDIPLLGRLMAIADVYDALVSERPYKKPFSHDDAVSIIVDGKGTHFDPSLIDIFEEVSCQLKADSIMAQLIN